MIVTVSGDVMIKWSRVVKIARSECYDYISKNGIAPTLRGLFYILVSKNVLPNTKSAYQRLSEVIAEARYLGLFPWEYIRDETRAFAWEKGISIADAEKVINNLEALSPEELNKLMREVLHSRYEISLSKWEFQKYRILVVVEKVAQFDAINKMVNVDLNWGVSVTTSRGFESATAVKSIADWVNKVKAMEATPVLLLVFDWDPSGEYASVYDLVFRVLMLLDKKPGRLLEKWSKLRSLDEKGEFVRELSEKNNLVFEKVLLTWEQVQKYRLPPEPQDENVRKKLQRDPRARMFMEKYGFLGQVEIDAMISIHYEETRRILDEAIRKYFDASLYEKVKEREAELRERLSRVLIKS